MGMPDLDFRPPPMERDNLPYYVQACPHCGYCAHDISSANKKKGELVHSSEYQAILNNPIIPELANRYLAMAYLSEKEQDLIGAFYSYQSASWVCDDMQNGPGVISCRKQASRSLKKIIDTGKRVCDEPGCDELLYADILRRCAVFDEAKCVVETGLTQKVEEPIRLALLFEQDLIHRWDTFCYRFDQVPGILEAIDDQKNHSIEDKGPDRASGDI